jgi:hypothetical protein
MTDRELLKLVEEGMKVNAPDSPEYIVCAALRARLAQPEPVIYARKEGNLIVADLPQVPRGSGGISKDEQRTMGEPVAYINVTDRTLEWAKPTRWETPTVVKMDKVPLYTAPPKKDEPVIDKSMAKRIATQLGWEPKREWVGLTDEEARELCVANVPYVIDMVRALEAKLKEKNT